MYVRVRSRATVIIVKQVVIALNLEASCTYNFQNLDQPICQHACHKACLTVVLEV